mgnify:CR=1 FL=1
MAKRIDGKVISKQIKDELKEEVAQLKAKGIEGSLAVIQVGNDPASSVYVNNKKKACEYIGIGSISYELPEETTEAELLDIIEDLNKREDVCGILVQLPVPKHIDEDKIIQAISPKKDVDGFHPQSVGAMTIGEPGFLSCTPAGIIQLLKRSNIEIEGKHCVVIGRSNIVGKPMALLMLRENATVTIAHSKTKNLKELCKQADILIVAIGKPKFIDESYVKEGAVVIEATISLTAFMFLIITILAITNICLAQAKIGTMVNGIAKDVSNYTYVYSMTGLNGWEQGVSDGANAARHDINEVLEDTTDTYEKIGRIINKADSDPEYWNSFKQLLKEQGINSGKSLVLNKVCKNIAKDRLTTEGKDADAYLKYLGIKAGIEGLDFSRSEFCQQGSNEIKIIVDYKVHMLEFFGIEWEFQFEQCAATKAWIAAGGSSTSEKKTEE